MPSRVDRRESGSDDASDGENSSTSHTSSTSDGQGSVDSSSSGYAPGPSGIVQGKSGSYIPHDHYHVHNDVFHFRTKSTDHRTCYYQTIHHHYHYYFQISITNGGASAGSAPADGGGGGGDATTPIPVQNGPAPQEVATGGSVGGGGIRGDDREPSDTSPPSLFSPSPEPRASREDAMDESHSIKYRKLNARFFDQEDESQTSGDCRDKVSEDDGNDDDGNSALSSQRVHT